MFSLGRFGYGSGGLRHDAEGRSRLSGCLVTQLLPGVDQVRVSEVVELGDALPAGGAEDAAQGLAALDDVDPRACRVGVDGGAVASVGDDPAEPDAVDVSAGHAPCGHWPQSGSGGDAADGVAGTHHHAVAITRARLARLGCGLGLWRQCGRVGVAGVGVLVPLGGGATEVVQIQRPRVAGDAPVARVLAHGLAVEPVVPRSRLVAIVGCCWRIAPPTTHNGCARRTGFDTGMRRSCRRAAILRSLHAHG